MKNKKNYNRIRIALAEKSKSNRELAKALKCSETTVSRWCTNDAQPDLKRLFQIAHFLKIESRELITLNQDV